MKDKFRIVIRMSKRNPQTLLVDSVYLQEGNLIVCRKS